jgi:hypothetical protein
MNRFKVLPHRRTGKNAGQCRDCGQYDVRSAPDTCPRCAIESYADQGCTVVLNPVDAFERDGWELWRNVAKQLRQGQIRSDRFYVFIADGDGGPLRRPVDELLDIERELPHCLVAHEIGLDLSRRHQQVWIVTTVGSWCVTSGPGGEQ